LIFLNAFGARGLHEGAGINLHYLKKSKISFFIESSHYIYNYLTNIRLRLPLYYRKGVGEGRNEKKGERTNNKGSIPTLGFT
jgi:hypothetical protein